MDKEINNNGYEYVDLGLPSGTLWATMNVGASAPFSSGLYFQWGDTNGYMADEAGIGEGKKKFTWDDYKWNPSGDGETFTKYAKSGAILDLEDDAAHIHMGGDWHMPEPIDFQELVDNTISTWETLYGVNGRLLTSKKDPSKSIFIPAVGYARNGSFYINGLSGSLCLLWSSMLDTYNINFGQQFCFLSIGSSSWCSDRFYGLPVRGVIG